MAESTAFAQFIVEPPFDTESMGDCVLQSPDGTKFKVHSAILRTASSVFHDIFNMPKKEARDPTWDKVETLVIPVEEDPETLQAMLQILYPVDPPKIESLSLAKKLVKAFDKYFISMTKLRQDLRSTLTIKALLEEDPLTCYALSWKLGMVREVETASRYTHTLDLLNVAVAKAIVSRSGDLAALIALFELRSRREERLDDLRDLVKLAGHFSCAKHAGLLISSTLPDRERTARLKEVLNAPYPTCENLEYFLGVQITRLHPSSTCSKCREAIQAMVSLTKAAVRGVLESYPQTVSSFPTEE